jgi:hypothetical protein
MVVRGEIGEQRAPIHWRPERTLRWLTGAEIPWTCAAHVAAAVVIRRISVVTLLRALKLTVTA